MKYGTVSKFDATEALESSTICGVILNSQKKVVEPDLTKTSEVTTISSELESTTVAKKGVEKMKDWIMYQFLEKFFLYLSGPIFVSLFAFVGFLINRLTEKINAAKEKKKEAAQKEKETKKSRKSEEGGSSGNEPAVNQNA